MEMVQACRDRVQKSWYVIASESHGGGHQLIKITARNKTTDYVPFTAYNLRNATNPGS